MSQPPVPSSSLTPIPPVNRHALTAVEKQRNQLERLLKDPAKPAFIPTAPKEKTLRPAREMMKNVQGSSAGAGSGEFHVYKASRRREYERLKLLEEESQKETTVAEFERKRREAEETANTKTSKNRAKRMKKKERSKTKGAVNKDGSGDDATPGSRDNNKPDVPLKKRRLINGKELVFRKPGEESQSEDEGENGREPGSAQLRRNSPEPIPSLPPAVLDMPRITIIEDD